MDAFQIKSALSAVAIILTLVAFFPYIYSILKGTVKPHVFSWAIWGIVTFIVFLAQLEGKGGVGAWPIGISGCITIFIAILAYIKKADLVFTRLDCLFFISALSSLPFWYFTEDPLWTVIILTTIDILGFGPTVRKAYYSPYSESLLFFSLLAIRNTIVVMALEHYSITTVLFPAAVAVGCLLLAALIIYRRQFFTVANIKSFP